MTSFSDEELGKLIEMIRQHPALYDSQHVSYVDKKLKDNIWKSIAEVLNKSDMECRKKWKLTKDSYNRCKRKHKRKCSTGSAAPSKNSKWEFFERLTFLDTIPSQRQTSTNITNMHDTSNSPSELAEALIKCEEISLSDEEGVLPEGSSTAFDSYTRELSTPVEMEATSKRKRDEDEFLKMKERHETRQFDLPTVSNQHNLLQSIDEISSFSKYIEMSLRKLTLRSKTMAKSEIFNIISKYEMMDIEGKHSRLYCSSSLSNSNPYSPMSTASPNAIPGALVDLHQNQNILINSPSSVPRQFQGTSSDVVSDASDTKYLCEEFIGKL